MSILGRVISFFSHGPAIQNLDSIDMRIDFKDGGVLLPIVASQHLDASDEIEELIRSKLVTYLRYIDSGALKGVAYIKVQFRCVKPPAKEAIRVIDSFQDEFRARDAALSWRS